MALLDDIESDPKYIEGMMEFDDLTHLKELAITEAELGKFADLLSGLSSRKRMPTKKAVLAPYSPGKEAAIGFSKLAEEAKYFEMDVFDNLTDALSFLGITEIEKFHRELTAKLPIH